MGWSAMDANAAPTGFKKEKRESSFDPQLKKDLWEVSKTAGPALSHRYLSSSSGWKQRKVMKHVCNISDPSLWKNLPPPGKPGTPLQANRPVSLPTSAKSFLLCPQPRCSCFPCADTQRGQRHVHGDQALCVREPHPAGELREGTGGRELEPRTGTPHPWTAFPTIWQTETRMLTAFIGSICSLIWRRWRFRNLKKSVTIRFCSQTQGHEKPETLVC